MKWNFYTIFWFINLYDKKKKRTITYLISDWLNSNNKYKFKIILLLVLFKINNKIKYIKIILLNFFKLLTNDNQIYQFNFKFSDGLNALLHLIKNL